MSNVIIIGKGPAGISASLYTVRAGIKTTIIGKDGGALSKAPKIENYFGFEEPVIGKELLESATAGAKRLGVDIIDGEVLSIEFQDKLTVITKDGSYPTDCIIIATGTSRSTPNIKGIKELDGHGVSYCAVCDAFFYRGLDIAVLGDGEYALHEALSLKQTSGKVTILTNGKEPSFEVPEGIFVRTDPIESFEGVDSMERVIFKDGNSLPIAGLFIAVGVAGSTALANKIGAITENNSISTDENNATNVPGVFAAGDCTGGLLQISKAVGDGAVAGNAAVKFIRSLAK
ncbi:NAD(P)/FAD-dependent oxidoreductase [Parasporobacterium paucivorans]|uniref:Thioredoxin reductase (NADPH) n=1 Tax=Parasporobacterium paucivorans DSM 15970 TaxID=1122934 RepID=A0A1M6ABC3_9FIRM|nr:NAD(P)/FAD-dependent oxidoreductase [Parasporobacterium paucivorans]SHI33463.1 thioredoxin reductase (NADPH) [Parasporobacterium paucivorans DSM 15970]